jgi:hypothetical protein
MASAVDEFIRGPIEIIGWAVPESGAKDFLRGLAKGTGAVSEALEMLSPNPKVFKVAKIGTDIAGVFVGTKGLVTAVTKAGQAIKLGHAAESLKYMVSGGAAALARDVVFVAEGTALAEAAATGTASLLLAEGSSKTLHEDVTGGSGIKVEGRGNTGRTNPQNLQEELAMKEVKSNPLEGATDLGVSGKFIMTDTRWPTTEGWTKMSRNVNGIEVHFVYNKVTHVFDDFKFV